jgi:hypothetical protein
MLLSGESVAARRAQLVRGRVVDRQREIFE